MSTLYLLLLGVGFVLVSLIITIVFFDVLLRGYAPYISSRPWVIKLILENIHLEKTDPVILSLGSGRSGFLHAIEKKYPQAHLFGIEHNFYKYLIAKIQMIFRRSKIIILKRDIHRVDFRNADLIYCHLEPQYLEGLNKRLKFGSHYGTQVLSTGFNIPYMDPKKIIELEDKNIKPSWFNKDRSLRKSKKATKLNRVYCYEIK